MKARIREIIWEVIDQVNKEVISGIKKSGLFEKSDLEKAFEKS